jgi:hypothetical protein
VDEEGDEDDVDDPYADDDDGEPARAQGPQSRP